MPTEKILLVEDDAVVRLDIQVALERAGYDIVGYSTSGERAIEMAESFNPDLVLMDIQLEGVMDGVEAAGEILRRFDIPVIYLTVVVDAASLNWAKNTGPLGYLVKPVDRNELKLAIEVGLYKHQMERELKKARREAEAANRAKTSFLATVSHELRTPMNGVLGMTELLLMSDIDAQYRENVQLIRESSMSLLSVLNQIIDYSKIEASSLPVREMDFRLEDMVSGLLSQYKRTSKIKGVTLEYSISPDVPGWIRGDTTKIRQILGNLINNAVKFTSSGQVMVDVSPPSNGDETFATDRDVDLAVQVLVQDTGIGIPAEKLDDIFESFNQAEDHLRHATGGLGLGLAIVSRLVSVLGGVIKCSSVEGKGSIFSVILPFKRSRYEDQAPSATVLSDQSPLKGANVLVAEDDLVNQRYIVRLLQKMGCNVLLAENGAQAVDVLKEQAFDIVFMDVEMPVMNGIEATRLIRKVDTGCLDPDVPIVALTARAMWGDEQRCIHVGMNDYVSKPVDIDTIAAIIQSTLNNE
nr:response regulator [uncultured Pseudodesulfovibrio sp.]